MSLFRRRDRSDVEPLIAVDERPTNVAGGQGAAEQSADASTGVLHAPGDYLLADHIMAAVEQLARDLARVGMPDVDWGVDDARFKDTFRAYAWAVAAVGWKPPVVLAAQASVATVARVLTDHELAARNYEGDGKLVSIDCSCSWRGPSTASHPAHQAEQLVALGVLG